MSDSANALDFSIIIAVYNAESYLGEAIESVLAQQFCGSFEIIVVDDGSSDGSRALAERFHDLRPDVIKVVCQENRGPSAARNAGFELARGGFVNFLDADDRLERNALRLVYRFFVKHGSEIDIVTLPILYFDARKGAHLLNFKFRRRKQIIDVVAEPDAILRHTTSSFIRRSAFRQRPFDEDVRYGEDALAILRLLLNRPRYGVIRGTRLLKRSRGDRSSLLDVLYDAPDNLEQMLVWHLRILAECVQRIGRVPPFVQASLLYDYQWQAKSLQFGFAFRDAGRRARYMAGVGRVLAEIDNDRIRAARFVSPAVRVLLCELTGEQPSAAALEKDGFDLPTVEVLFIQAGEEVVIEGRAFQLNKGRLVATVNGTQLELSPNPSLDGTVLFFGDDLKRWIGFTVVIRSRNSLLEFALCEAGRVTKLPISYGPRCRLADRRARRHGVLEGLCFAGGREGVWIKSSSAVGRGWRQTAYLFHLAIRLRLKPIALRLLAHGVRAGRKVSASFILLDRVGAAGDNAEVLFLHALHHRSASDSRPVLFCVSRASPDYARLKVEGKVIAYGGLRHKIEMFRGTIIISSHANPATFNPFGRDERFLSDLIHVKRIFVQHGIMNSSQCHWCGREAANLDLVTTTVGDEYQMMLAAHIGYTTKQLRLTGMARFDRLSSEAGDTIVLMPTWRQGLLHQVGRLTSFAERTAAFESSDFARAWRELAESEELLRLAVRRGVKIVLVWHPQIYANFRRWNKGDKRLVEASLGREVTDFERLKSTAILLVTDYSSISFDFAYLSKPVAYYQFDADRILADRSYHSYAPDFNFAEKGFGPILSDRGGVIRWVIDTVEAGGCLREPYKARAERFFQFRDRGNCDRIWDEITSAFPRPGTYGRHSADSNELR